MVLKELKPTPGRPPYVMRKSRPLSVFETQDLCSLPRTPRSRFEDHLKDVRGRLLQHRKSNLAELPCRGDEFSHRVLSVFATVNFSLMISISSIRRREGFSCGGFRVASSHSHSRRSALSSKSSQVKNPSLHQKTIHLFPNPTPPQAIETLQNSLLILLRIKTARGNSREERKTSQK